jgi:hypothetical protein
MNSIGTALASPYIKFTDADGVAVANGWVTTYLAGTGTEVATFADQDLQTPNANPLQLDASGGAVMYFDPVNGGTEAVSYKVLLQDEDLVTIDGYPIDHISVTAPSAGPNLTTAVIGYGSATTLTIAGGAITPTRNAHMLNPEGGSPDNLDNIAITGLPDGAPLIIGNNNGAAAITVRTGVGNILLSAGDYVLSTTIQRLQLQRSGANWVGVDRQSGVGDFVGPASSTDNAVVRFNGTTGKLGQNSLLIVSDAGVANLPAGTGSQTMNVGGTIAASVTSVGNSGTGETTLWTVTIPAATLAVDDDVITYEAWGTGDSGSDTKTLRLYWAGVQVTALTGSSSPAGNFPSWYIRGSIVRTGATSQIITMDTVNGISGSNIPVTTGAATLANSNVFLITGQGASSNQLVFKYGRLRFDPHP